MPKETKQEATKPAAEEKAAEPLNSTTDSVIEDNSEVVVAPPRGRVWTHHHDAAAGQRDVSAKDAAPRDWSTSPIVKNGEALVEHVADSLANATRG